MTQDKDRFRVLVAEDHPVFRQGLIEEIERKPELEVVSQAATGEEALAGIREHRPDVAVIDMKMPGLDGLDVARCVTHDKPPSNILILSAYFDPHTIYQAVEAGVLGYVSKDSDGDVICDAILRVAQGHTVMCGEAQRALADQVREGVPTRPGPGPRLSPREREVLELTAAGNSAEAVANQLYLSRATVKTHLQRVYQKLGVSDRAAAVAEAMRRGMLN